MTTHRYQRSGAIPAGLVLLALLGMAPPSQAQNPFLQRDRQRTITGIQFLGNRVTQESILRREFGLTEGDPYAPMAISDAWERLEQLDYIAYVDIQEERPTPDSVQLVVQIEEDTRFHLTPVLHYERRFDGVVLGTDSVFRNFRGRAEKVRLSTAWWHLHAYQLSWTNPRPIGALAAGVMGKVHWMRYDFEFEPFRLRDQGFAVGGWYDFGRWVRFGAEYLYRDFEFDESDDGAFEGGSYDPAVTLSLGHDSRNIQYYPSLGAYVDLRLRLGGVGRSGDYRLTRGRVAGFYPLPWLLILGGRVDAQLSNDPVPIYERSYLGGPADLRGVEFGSVEGDQSFLATIELRRPIFLIPLRDGKTVGVGVHAFHDWGKAWDHGSGFDDAPIHYSYGAGAHFNFNTRSFRFEWARSDDGDNSFVFEDTLTF